MKSDSTPRGGGSEEHPFASSDHSAPENSGQRKGPAPLEPLSDVPPVPGQVQPDPAPEPIPDLDLSLGLGEPECGSLPAALPSTAGLGAAAPAPDFQLEGAALGADPVEIEQSTQDQAQNLGSDIGSDLDREIGLELGSTLKGASEPGPEPLPESPAMAHVPSSLHATSISPRHQLEAWLAAMVQSGASDLILRAGGKPSCRVDGKIRFLPGRVPGAGALLEVLNGVVGLERMDTWSVSGSVDVAVQLDGLGRFRLNAYKQMGEPAVVLRRISENPPLLENLGLPTAEMKRIASRKRGIILVTGIAGSGKSTTLAALIQYMNLHFERHVVTLEDPVEMLFSEDRCVISQREIGTDCPNFSEGLRHALRQSPDVLLIGEMRDAETVSAALDATETGHLVLSTLHTVNAAQTVDRILSFFPAEQHAQVRQRLAENLGAVLSQRLVPRATGKGMIPAFELMTSTPHVRELLTEGRTSEISRVIDASLEQGLISFNQSLRDLVESAQVDLEIALSASDRPDELMMALRGFQHGGNKQVTTGGGEETGSNGLRMAGP